jgi:hypothetical protein
MGVLMWVPISQGALAASSRATGCCEASGRKPGSRPSTTWWHQLSSSWSDWPTVTAGLSASAATCRSTRRPLTNSAQYTTSIFSRSRRVRSTSVMLRSSASSVWSAVATSNSDTETWRSSGS